MSLLTVRVVSIHQEAAGVVSLKLVPADAGAGLPGAEAGAHVDLHLAPGLVRSYSLYRPSDGSCYDVAVQLAPDSRGGSRYVHEQLRAGGELRISMPRNHFPLRAHEGPAVLLAGGIGITPLHAMVVARAREGRETHLIYCARSSRTAAFLSSLESLRGPSLSVHCHFDDVAGTTPDLMSLLQPYGPEAHYYACGPAAMLEGFQDACRRLQYPLAYLERFSAEPVQAPAATLAPYEVELARSGRVLMADPAVPLLETLRDAGVSVGYSCEEGICGSCETRVLSGEIDHRDSILADDEKQSNQVMMVCVSHCKSGRLVLDL